MFATLDGVTLKLVHKQPGFRVYCTSMRSPVFADGNLTFEDTGTVIKISYHEITRGETETDQFVIIEVDEAPTGPITGIATAEAVGPGGKVVGLSFSIKRG